MTVRHIGCRARNSAPLPVLPPTPPRQPLSFSPLPASPPPPSYLTSSPEPQSEPPCSPLPHSLPCPPPSPLPVSMPVPPPPSLFQPRASSRPPTPTSTSRLHRDVSTGLLRRDHAHLHGLRHLAQLRHIHLPGHPLAPITFDLSLSSDHVHFEFEPAGRTHSPHPTHLHTAHRTLERRPYAACDGPACSFVAAWLLGPTA